MSIITTSNHGPLIVTSSYWDSDYDRAGKIFCSVNAGCVRVLLPQANRQIVQECRTAKYVVLSRGPWPEVGAADAVELLFEDGTESPFSLHLTAESFDMLPGEPGDGQQWTVAVWTLKKGRPQKMLERPCFWRRVAKLPCLKPWGG